MAIRVEFIFEAQVREMHKHRWIEGVKRNCDPGEEAFLEWVAKYAALFRKWVEMVPEECIGCNIHCDCDRSSYCCHPFDEGRIQFWMDSLKEKSEVKQ